MYTTNTRINPYFQSQQRKPSPLRQSFYFEQQKKCNAGNNQSKQGGYRFHKQISPDVQKNVLEQTQSKLSDFTYQMVASADEKLVKPDSTNSQNSTGSNMKRSPSFRLKSYKRPTSKYNKKDDPSSRNARIMHLESYVQNLSNDDHITPVSSGQNNSPKPGKKQSVPVNAAFASDYSTNLTILEDQDQNIEEIHFHQVEFQQQCKKWLQNVENKRKTYN